MRNDDSHDGLVDCNLLIVKNKNGSTRVYSIGFHEERDIEIVFSEKNQYSRVPRYKSRYS